MILIVKSDLKIHFRSLPNRVSDIPLIYYCAIFISIVLQVVFLFYQSPIYTSFAELGISVKILVINEHYKSPRG